MKKRILFVTPHLSTGGLPQYLLKKIEHFVKQFEVWCIEWSDLSPIYVVQKNEIRKILGDKLITLGEDKSFAYDAIKAINPNIIHFEEIPETFISVDTLSKLYSENRTYNIVVTTHSSQTQPDSIKFTADKFVLVSEWSRLVFEQFFNKEDSKIECDVWEYPIEYKTADKVTAQQKLNFDPNFKHVLNVGLFTSGKNQKELIDIARFSESNGNKIKFHFVGNQAPNFQDYWGPLMNNLPSNCVIHGERNDTSDFYQACDVFYFTSNLELNPLVLKEAISWKMKTFAKKLHTYGNTYDNLVQYITGDLKKDYENLVNFLKPDTEIPGWFSYSELYDSFINECKDNSTIVEIGSWFGKSTSYLIDKIKTSGKNIDLHVIDTFKGSLNEQLHQDIVSQFDNDIYQNFYDNIGLYEDITIHKNFSNDAAVLFNNSSIDYILIDGDHSYEGVTADIKNYFHKVKPGGVISGDDYNVFDGTTRAVNEYFLGAQTITPNNINWWYRKPRIQIKHVTTTPMKDRAKKSIKNFEILKKYGFDVDIISNEPYTGEINLTKYANQSNLANVRPSHYGCWLGHTQALSEIDEENYDFTLILEEDAFIYSSVSDFVEMVYKAIFTCQVDKSIAYVSLGADIWVETKPFNHLFDECWHQTLAHCYLIPSIHKSWYSEKIKEGKWDSADLWLNQIFHESGKKRLFTKQKYSKQINGISIIDNVYKDYSTGNY